MHSREMKGLLLALTITAIFNTATRAQTVALDSIATTIGHQFATDPDTGGTYTADYIYGASWGAVTPPSYTANLSSLTSISLTLNAPPGYEFDVTSQNGSLGTALSFGVPLLIWSTSGWTSLTNISLPTQVSFTNYNGPSWYSNTTESSVSTDGRAFMVGGSLWWSGAPQVTFTSVTLEANLSSLNGYGFLTGTFNPAIGEFDAIQYLDTLSMDTEIDPGSAVSLVAIPEPSTYAAVLGVAALGLAVIWRRRAAVA